MAALSAPPSMTRSAKPAKILKGLMVDKLLLDQPAQHQRLVAMITQYLDAFAADDNDIGKVTIVEHVVDTRRPPTDADATATLFGRAPRCYCRGGTQM